MKYSTEELLETLIKRLTAKTPLTCSQEQIGTLIDLLLEIFDEQET